MIFRYLAAIFLTISVVSPNATQATEQAIPEQVYQELDYAMSLTETQETLDPNNFSELIDFMIQQPAESDASLQERQGASGAFYSFTVHSDHNRILDYVYNPDIPIYITSPSSLRSHEWLTPQTEKEMKELPRTVETQEDIRLLRGKEKESITPDTNTGGYYSYNQNRAMAIFPGPTGPVIVSTSSQPESSDVGMKGCVVGDDKNWNYLFSGEPGLNKMGMGWVDSYMYQANSVLVYVTDLSSNTVKIGTFKWLNAGWKSINMVKSSHILNGQKRFASDFKTIIEAPDLPEPQTLANKYKELQQASDQQLRQEITPYFEGILDMDSSAVCSSLFKKQLTSGKYIDQIDRDEMIRILLLEYVKNSIGKEVLVSTAAKADTKQLTTFN